MAMVVRPWDAWFRAACTIFSDSESRAEVASSRSLWSQVEVSVVSPGQWGKHFVCVARNLEKKDSTYRIEGFLIKARAMEILCFCPPESKTPLVPTIVSNP
jgi:hypothetical protein